MDEIRLSTLISHGECATVEFKREAREAKTVCKAIAAMATGQGGMLLIGIQNDGGIVGVPDAIDVRDRIERWIHEHVAPAPTIDIQIVNLELKDVVAIEIADGIAPFYSSHDISYIRIGTSSQPLKPHQIIDLVRGRPIEDLIRSFESTLAVLQSSLAVTQSMAISAKESVAPGITGQGQLATMQYTEVRDRIFAELEGALPIMALQANVAVAHSMAALARSAPALALENQGDLATTSYVDLIARLIEDPQLLSLTSASRSDSLSVLTTALGAQANAQMALNEIAAIKLKLSAFGS